MYFKSLVAATIITVSAVTWQVKYVTPAGSAHGEATEVDGSEHTAPSWIEDPQGFFSSPHSDLLVATGSAKIRGNKTAAHNRAMLRARMNLVKAKGAANGTTHAQTARTLPTGEVETTVRSENSTTVRTTHATDEETLMFERVDGKLRENRELARWTSPEGVLWVLVATSR